MKTYPVPQCNSQKYKESYYFVLIDMHGFRLYNQNDSDKCNYCLGWESWRRVLLPALCQGPELMRVNITTPLVSST